jgi:hypothetical protein
MDIPLATHRTSPRGDPPPADVVAGLLKRTGATIECELRGHSMGSTLPDGACLRLRFVETPQLAVGDVIAFGAAGALTVHRIVGRGLFGPARSFLLTRGDGAVLPDHPVHVKAVLGVVQEWKSGDTWLQVPPCRATGWRAATSGVVLWPVLVALHLEHRLALLLTATAFVVRWALGRVRQIWCDR